MTNIDRRTVLAGSAVALAGSALATPASAQGGTKTVFEVAQTTIPIEGQSEVFPVRRINCIGRNYAAQALARGSDPTREPPFFFQQPPDANQTVPTGKVADHP